jgi:putative Holliday junction resolvase
MTIRKKSKASLPAQGRLMGLDYGSKRFGVALSNDEQTIASPLENRTRRSPDQDGAFLASLATDYNVVGLVVGLPVHMSGQEGGKAREARNFGQWAGRVTGLPVRYYDERYTSLIAEHHLLAAGVSEKKRKERLDKVAAQVLLQAYLDSPDRTAAPAALREAEARPSEKTDKDD